VFRSYVTTNNNHLSAIMQHYIHGIRKFADSHFKQISNQEN